MRRWGRTIRRSAEFVTPRASSAPPEGAGDPPGVGLLVAVVQGLEALLFLLLAEACGVGHLEEGRGELHQPAGVDGGHLPHVLLGGQDQLVIHEPVGGMTRAKVIIFIND